MPLSQATIHNIDHVSNVEHSSDRGSLIGIPTWLTSIGDLISQFLPTFIAVFNALRSLPQTPSPAQFAAKMSELFPTDKAA